MPPLATIQVATPLPGAECPQAAVPQPGLVPLEFFCQPVSMSPVWRPEWRSTPLAEMAPPLLLRPIWERVEEVELPAPSPAPKTPAFAEIFTITRAARRNSQSSLRAAAKAVAAALLVAVGLWFGTGSVKIGRQLLALRSESPTLESPSAAPTSYGPGPAVAAGRPASGSPASSAGVLTRMRRAIQHRAALEYTDTFRAMEAWGGTAKALPAGWSRNPDGYVQTGQLALYRPSLPFSDYRFEFFGEIEKKSIGWAVRAHDTANYYAMKFTVVEPGLRPVIAVEHYSVVDGKKGRRVEVPLNVMVHNNTAYHVAVDVRGNRVVTSIEGQEVDSWTDDRFKTGGVGFFSDAGESARVYWIKVARNQDWLGRVCSYLAGNGEATTVGALWLPLTPTVPYRSPHPATARFADLILADAETGGFSFAVPHRAAILKNGRIVLCSS